jgi:uncharacterized membrane protein
VSRGPRPGMPHLVRRREDRFADVVTRWSGSVMFVNLHVIWFAGWVAVNLAVPRRAFDPFPFGLLTLIVSLEAIFLSTFVLMSQNRQTKISDAREVEDYETDLYTQALVRKIAQHLGVDLDQVEAEVVHKLARLDRPAGAPEATGPGK